MMKMFARLILIKFLTQGLQLYILMASTGPNWWWMSLSVSRLQIFLEELLADIWVSSPQGSMLKHIEDYISSLWSLGTFYNFYPFEIQFFSIIIYLILTFPNVV